ncbi:MAG: TRAP transporter substrate-binding protein, partial [Limnohabitans sp.]
MIRSFWLALTLLAALCAPASAQTVLRLNGWLPPTHPIMTRTLKPWAEEVAKVTQGRVRIEVTASSLGPPPKQVDMVRDNVVDLVFSVHGYTPQRFALARVGELPFLSDLSEPLSVALWRVTETHFAARDEHAGMQLLALWAAQPGRVWTTKKPLKSVKDWDGMKLAGGAAINVDISTAMGAVGIRAAGPQASEMVRRGVADGLFIDASSFTDFSLGGTIKHLLDFPKGIYSATFFLGMNKAKWNALSAEDRAAILKISGETLSRAAGRNWDAEAAKSRENVKANNVEVTMASGAYLKELE